MFLFTHTIHPQLTPGRPLREAHICMYSAGEGMVFVFFSSFPFLLFDILLPWSPLRQPFRLPLLCGVTDRQTDRHQAGFDDDVCKKLSLYRRPDGACRPSGSLSLSLPLTYTHTHSLHKTAGGGQGPQLPQGVLFAMTAYDRSTGYIYSVHIYIYTVQYSTVLCMYVHTYTLRVSQDSMST